MLKSFLVLGINSNLSDANYHIVLLETDLKTIFNNEDDVVEVFHSFAVKDIAAATTANINQLIVELYDSYNILIN